MRLANDNNFDLLNNLIMNKSSNPQSDLNDHDLPENERKRRGGRGGGRFDAAHDHRDQDRVHRGGSRRGGDRDVSPLDPNSPSSSLSSSTSSNNNLNSNNNNNNNIYHNKYSYDVTNLDSSQHDINNYRRAVANKLKKRPSSTKKTEMVYSNKKPSDKTSTFKLGTDLYSRQITRVDVKNDDVDEEESDKSANISVIDVTYNRNEKGEEKSSSEKSNSTPSSLPFLSSTSSSSSSPPFHNAAAAKSTVVLKSYSPLRKSLSIEELSALPPPLEFQQSCLYSFSFPLSLSLFFLLQN